MSHQQEWDKNSGDKDTSEERNNQQGQHTARNDYDDSRLDSSSDSSSSRASSVRSILQPHKYNQEAERAKSVEQEHEKSTTGILIPLGQKKLSRELKGIKIEVPENSDRTERKWTDLQYLDEWVNAVQLWFVINSINLDSAEALEVVGFKLTGSALTTYNYFRRDKGKTATFFNFILLLHNFLISYSSKDLLRNRWETANPYNKARNIGINKFSNWLSKMQLKIIDNNKKHSISLKVNRRNFWHHLLQYMEGTLMC